MYFCDGGMKIIKLQVFWSYDVLLVLIACVCYCCIPLVFKYFSMDCLNANSDGIFCN
jgi:hypothetical protein